MTITTAVTEILAMLDDFAKPGLLDRELFGQFLQHAADSGKQKDLGDLAFLGKYLWKLYGTLDKHPAGEDIRLKLEEEFASTLPSFRRQLDEFSSGAASDFRSTVESRLLALSGDALKNIMDTAHDFSWLKNWELEMQSRQARR